MILGRSQSRGSLAVENESVRLSDPMAMPATRLPVLAVWSMRGPDAWLAPPSFLAGAGSIIDLMGSSHWYDPRRLTVEGSRRALAGDLVVVGRDLRRAASEVAVEHGLEVDPEAPRLFDPDKL